MIAVIGRGTRRKKNKKNGGGKTRKEKRGSSTLRNTIFVLLNGALCDERSSGKFKKLYVEETYFKCKNFLIKCRKTNRQEQHSKDKNKGKKTLLHFPRFEDKI